MTPDWLKPARSRAQYTTVQATCNSRNPSLSLLTATETSKQHVSYQSSVEIEKQTNSTGRRLLGTSSSFKRVKRRCPTFSRKKYDGWRLSVYLGMSTSVLVFFANLSLLIWGAAHVEGGFNIGTLTRGTVKSVSAISTAYHVLINVLSTVLLSASNFSMQVLSSPTRKEVDRAHAQGKRLEIGILSTYNLRHVAVKRQILWWILFLSSFPLHLFYNSTVSDVTSGRQYNIAISSLTDRNFTWSRDWHNWTQETWYQPYRTQYVPGFADLQLFVDAIAFGVVLNTTDGSFAGFQKNVSNSVHGRASQISMPLSNYTDHKSTYPSFEWPQPIFVDPSVGKSIKEVLPIDDNGWIGVGDLSLHVANATSRVIDNGSKVQIALPFMIIITICNVMKVAVMYYMLQSLDSELLVTAGDAIQSFLRRPDLSTLGCCMLSEYDISKKVKQNRTSSIGNPRENMASFLGNQSKPELASAKQRRRLLTPLTIISICGVVSPIILVTVFLNKDIRMLDRFQWGTASQLTWNIGLARVDASGVLYNTLISNIPQVILSSAYFFVNRFLTQLASAVEWGRWGVCRKYLRVSKPEGYQRSTYFLQLPYRIAIPMMVFSGLLHWLLSQALFLRRLEVYDLQSSVMTHASMCTVGYSPVSLTVFFVMTFIGGILILIQTVLLVPDSKIPYGANSSLIISAACHPPPDEIDTNLKPLKWGVVQNRFPNTTIQHCTFTSEEVEEPQGDMDYA